MASRLTEYDQLLVISNRESIKSICSNYRLNHEVKWPLNPFKRHILDSSKMRGVADDDFDIHVNAEKFSKRVDNAVGKGEIARYE